VSLTIRGSAFRPVVHPNTKNVGIEKRFQGVPFIRPVRVVRSRERRIRGQRGARTSPTAATAASARERRSRRLCIRGRRRDEPNSAARGFESFALYLMPLRIER